MADIATLTVVPSSVKTWASSSRRFRWNISVAPRNFVVDKNNTTIVEGAGERKVIDARVAQIRTQIEQTDSEYDRENCKSDWPSGWRCSGDQRRCRN